MAAGRRLRPRRRHPGGPGDAAPLGGLARLRKRPNDGRAPAPCSAWGLVVSDIDAAREDLVRRGVEVSDVFHRDGGQFLPGPDPERRSYLSYASFSDPDGNGFLLQEVTTRLPGRVWGTEGTAPRQHRDPAADGRGPGGAGGGCARHDEHASHAQPAGLPRRRDRVAQLRAAVGRRPARERRRRPVLHLLVHQLDPDAAVRPGMGGRVRATAGWSSSGSTPRSSPSSASSRGCAGRWPRWASSTRSCSTTGTRSGARSTTTTGPRSISSTARAASATSISARAPTSETEAAIQQLLGVDGETVRVEATGIEAAGRLGHPGVPGDVRRPRTRRAPRRRRARRGWRSTSGRSPGGGRSAEEAAVLEAAGGSIAYRFEARDLNLVLTPSAPGAAVRFDGPPRRSGRPATAHGIDVDERGHRRGRRAAALPARPPARRRRRAHLRDHASWTPASRAYVFTFG